MQKQQQKYGLDNFDISGIHSSDKTLLLDISAIPSKDDFCDDDGLFYQLTVLQEMDRIQEQPNDKSLIELARQLKRKVINILENYSQLINRKDNAIRDLIPKDIAQIEEEYCKLLKECDQVEMPNKEVQAITKLVGEFIGKMSVRTQQKAHTQPPTQNQNSYESDESTSLPNKTIGTLNTKIKELLSKIPQEHTKIINLAKEILNNSDTQETFKCLRNEAKTIQNNALNKLVKACYLKVMVQQEQSQNTSKREFYDLVIKLKSQVPADHKVHQVMISYLYEDILTQGVPAKEWEQYMKQKLSL